MKTRNLISIFTLGLLVAFTTAFVSDAWAGSGPVRIRRTVEVHEKYRGHDGGHSYRYERWESRPGRHDYRYEHRDRYRSRSWYRDHACDLPAHRHWRPHHHDHDGHVYFFFGWSMGHTGVFIGVP